jgi:hypothetical protein
MYKFCIVTHQYGMEMLSFPEMVLYCREWWGDVSMHDDGRSADEYSDDEIWRRYFDIHAERGMTEYYEIFTVSDSQLEQYRATKGE